MRVALFITCVTDTLFPDTGRATVAVLERMGCEVVFPMGQTCCGQMHANSGYTEDAVPLVRRFVDVFDDPAWDAIVTPSGSCAAMVKDQHVRIARFAEDPDLEARAQALAPRVHELSQFLVDVLGTTDVGAHFPHRVTFHPTCHALRLLHAGDAQRELLELEEATTCCGFGGTFAVKNAGTSAAMLADKVAHVLETGAEACTAGDSSCLLHIGGGLARNRTGVRAVHLAEILASTEAQPA